MACRCIEPFLLFFGSAMEQLREIQHLIDRNHEVFREVKKHEKRERVQLKHEEERMRVYLMRLGSKR